MTGFVTANWRHSPPSGATHRQAALISAALATVGESDSPVKLIGKNDLKTFCRIFPVFYQDFKSSTQL